MSILKSFLLWRNLGKKTNFLTQKIIRHSSQSQDFLEVKKDSSGYDIVSMRRHPVNGLNYELLSELLSTFMELENSNSKGMILTSSLNSVFSAGLDITEMFKPDADRLKKFWTALQDTWLQLYSSSYPTVAVINGHAPAGGCLLALSCEYRVMLEGGFTIGLNETNLGIVAPSWFIDSFRNVVPQRESELALTLGKLFPVSEALKIGLIDDTAKDKSEAIEKSVAFLNMFMKINPAARAQTKVALRYDAIRRLQDGRDQDLKAFVNFVTLPEVQKGLDLYMQQLKKRPIKS